MATAQHSLSLEQFLKLPETKPHSEYWDGRIVQKPLPKGKHSILQLKWLAKLNERAEPLRMGLALPELRCTFAGRSIVPDVAYVTWERIPRDPSGEIGNEFFQAPDLAIEVRSPEQPMRQLEEKLTFCVQNGCRIGVLVDPDSKRATVVRPDRPFETLTRGVLCLSPVIDGLSFTVEEVFGWLVI